MLRSLFSLKMDFRRVLSNLPTSATIVTYLHVAPLRPSKTRISPCSHYPCLHAVPMNGLQYPFQAEYCALDTASRSILPLHRVWTPGNVTHIRELGFSTISQQTYGPLHHNLPCKAESEISEQRCRVQCTPLCQCERRPRSLLKLWPMEPIERAGTRSVAAYSVVLAS